MTRDDRTQPDALRIAELVAEYDIPWSVRHEAAALLRSLHAENERLRGLYRRAISEANGLTNYIDDRPELYSAERRIAKIEEEARAALGRNE